MALKKVEVDRNLPVTSKLKMFNVLEDEQRIRFLNIFKNYVVSESVKDNELLFDYYTVEEEDWFENISYKFYQTPYLWWVIAVFNDIVNPFEGLEEGNIIRVLKYGYIYTIFDDINEIGEL